MNSRILPSDASPAGYSRRDAASVLAALIAVSVTLNVVILPFTQVADPIRASFGITDLQFSYLLGAFFALPTMAMSIGGGWLADRLSRRRLMIVAMLAWTGGAIWTALAPSYEQLAMGRLLVAAAAGIKFPLSMTWISDAYPPERRGRAVGAIFVVVNIGPAIGATIGGVVLHAAEAGRFSALPWLGSLEPWRVAIVLLALSNLLVLPWVALLRDTRPVRTVGESATSEGGAQVPWFLVSAIVAGASLLSLADTANLAWLPTVLRRQHGFDAQQAGFSFGLITTAAGLCGSLLGGQLGDWAYQRRGAAGRLALGAFGAAVSAPLLLAYAGNSATWLITALVLGGILSVMSMTVGYVAIQACLPAHRRGFGTGIAHAVTNLAAASAPTIVAFTSARLPAGPSSLGGGVAIVTAVAFLAAGLVFAGLAWRVARDRAALPVGRPPTVAAPA